MDDGEGRGQVRTLEAESMIPHPSPLVMLFFISSRIHGHFW